MWEPYPPSWRFRLDMQIGFMKSRQLQPTWVSHAAVIQRTENIVRMTNRLPRNLLLFPLQPKRPGNKWKTRNFEVRWHTFLSLEANYLKSNVPYAPVLLRFPCALYPVGNLFPRFFILSTMSLWALLLATMGFSLVMHHPRWKGDEVRIVHFP